MPTVSLPDGTSVVIPDDATPDQLAQFKQKLSQKYGVSTGNDYKPDRVQSFLTGVGQSFPGADEAAAGIYSLVNNVPYDEARAGFQKGIDVNQETNPVSFIGGSLVPLIAGGVEAKLAKEALGAAPEAGRLAKYAAENPIKSAAGAGALSGGVYGFGSGSGDAEERAKSAAAGAAIGAPLGAAGGYVANKITGGIDTALSKIATKQAVKSVELPASAAESLSPAEKKVMEKLRLDFPDEADFQDALARFSASKDKGLVEAVGPETQTSRLAEGANQFPSSASASKNYFDERIGGSGARLKQGITDYISPKINYLDTLDEVVASGRKAAEPFYKQAYSSNPSISSPEISQILETPAGKQALASARIKMQNDRIALPDEGEGTSLQTLDYVKRSLDDKIGDAVRSGANDEVRIMKGLKSDLVKSIDNADKSGAYAKARRISGDYLSNSDALESGKNFLKEDIEQVKRNIASFGNTERESYRVGVAKTLRDQIDSTQDGANVTRIFNKKATRDKLATVLGPKEYDNLLGYVKSEDDIFKLRNQITSNSRTKIRDIASQEFDNQTLGNIHEIAQKGWKDTAIDKTLGFLKQIRSGLSDKTAGDVANILYETDPKKKLDILQKLRQTSIAAKNDLQRTEAAQKLELFYGANDIIRNARVTQGAAAGELAGEKGN